MTTEQLIQIVRGAQKARETLLKRRPLDEYDVSESLQQGIQDLFGERLTPDRVVERILSDVKAGGDEAVEHYSQLLDGFRADTMRVSAERIEEAWQDTDADLREALQLAADRIRAFYEHQYRQSWLEWDEEGGALGQMIRPLERVAIYAPNGRAAYPSSVLMAAMPARVAGVPQIVLASPPRQGRMNDLILAAAHVCGIKEVYSLGGAQAIGALAYGTETIPQVDKILGPGNIFVVLAMRRVYGIVGIGSLPGPTETLLIADEGANPEYVAADMLAQAEHDPLASALLLTPSEALAQAVRDSIAQQLANLSRSAIIRQSLAGQGGIVITTSLDEAFDLANEFAPEHLCLLTENPWQQVPKVRNAGGVFVGEQSSEALGDYVTGPSHIMPTGQTARFSSPVNVWDFCKITSIFGASRATVRRTGRAAIALAEQEELTAHAQAVRLRLSEQK